jgi:hypothetical protein
MSHLLFYAVILLFDRALVPHYHSFFFISFFFLISYFNLIALQFFSYFVPTNCILIQFFSFELEINSLNFLFDYFDPLMFFTTSIIIIFLMLWF